MCSRDEPRESRTSVPVFLAFLLFVLHLGAWLQARRAPHQTPAYGCGPTSRPYRPQLGAASGSSGPPFAPRRPARSTASATGYLLSSSTASRSYGTPSSRTITACIRLTHRSATRKQHPPRVTSSPR